MAERLNRVGGDMPATNGSLAPVLGLPRALQCGEVMQLTSQVPQFSNEAVVQGKVSLFQWGHQVGARPTSCLSEAARPSADTRRQVPHLHLPSFLQVDRPRQEYLKTPCYLFCLLLLLTHMKLRRILGFLKSKLDVKHSEIR